MCPAVGIPSDAGVALRVIAAVVVASAMDAPSVVVVLIVHASVESTSEVSVVEPPVSLWPVQVTWQNPAT